MVMKTLNLARIFVLNLLKLKIFFNKFAQYTYSYFRGVLNRENMDQDEADLEVVEQPAEENLVEDEHRYPLEYLDIFEYPNMDLGEQSSDTSDDDMSIYTDESSDSSETEFENRVCNISSTEETFERSCYSFQPLKLIKCLYKNRHQFCAYPIARSGHRITASQSHLYSLGGYNPDSGTNTRQRNACMLFQELWAYNFATNRWKLLQNAGNPDMPRELASNALAIYNNVLISHGGTGYPFGETCSNDCYVYTTGENPQVILLKVSGDLPAEQYGPGIVIHNNYLYTIGGTTGFAYSCDVYRLNLKTRVWQNVYICRPEMRDDPEGRYRHEVVYDGRHIYVIGGGTAHNVYGLQNIPAFNLETNHWDYFETLPDRTAATSEDPGYPRARKCLSCVQHALSNGDIEAFITGGLQGDFTTYFNDIWKLNLRTKQWHKIHSATLPRPLYFHSAAHAGNGCMYIFGGIEYTEKDVFRRNDLFKMWMTIPKLSDMCWDAITYYNRDLNNFSASNLLRAGIPERYVNLLPRIENDISYELHSPNYSPSSPNYNPPGYNCVRRE